MAKNTDEKKLIKNKSTSKKSQPSKPEQKKKKSVSSKVIAKKPYIEFVTAFLSIPVLITVLLLNFNSLKNMNASPTPTPTQKSSAGFFGLPLSKSSITPEQSVNRTYCEKGLGPISIDSPKEGDSVKENPVIITITYDNSIYCNAAWSYRINGGEWSGYTDSSLGLYNLPQGNVSFELRVKSIVTGDEKTLTRHFIYKGTSTYPTNSVASDSAQ